ncbi:tyrosine-type recombinase/integrase [Sandarakinorhabdus sp.]|uniref:tyrosine-type recombinase/integrase n=1 Tax=Sandarakinorhabdus sp. TaxID=1916663 RepID=UPI003F718701
MPALNITEDALRRIGLPDAGRVVYSDTKLKGFSVVVGKQSRSFYAQRDVHGRTHKVFLGRHGEISVIEARKAAEDVIHGMRRGEARYLERENPTLRSALKGYLGATTACSAHKTYVQRACEVRLKDWLDHALRDVTRGMIRTKHAALGREGKTMANDTLRAFRTVYNYALAEYERASLPVCPTIALRGKWFTEANERNSAIRDLAAWKKAVDALENPTHRHIYMLCLLTGLRKTEACRLEWNRVLDDRIFIRENKSNRPFYLPLLDEHRAVIDVMKGLHKQWVFPDRTNKGPTIDPRHEEVPGTMHSLRHTFASVGAEIGVPDDIIARLLNHSSTKITSRYIAVDVSALREPMQLIVNEIMKRLHASTDSDLEEVKLAA